MLVPVRVRTGLGSTYSMAKEQLYIYASMVSADFDNTGSAFAAMTLSCSVMASSSLRCLRLICSPLPYLRYYYTSSTSAATNVSIWQSQLRVCRRDHRDQRWWPHTVLSHFHRAASCEGHIGSLQDSCWLAKASRYQQSYREHQRRNPHLAINRALPTS